MLLLTVEIGVCSLKRTPSKANRTRVKDNFASVETAQTPKLQTVPSSVFGPVDPTSFRVREGPNYKRNRQKTASGPALCHCLGGDLFKTKRKTLGLANHLVLPRNIYPGANPDEQ